MANGAEAAFTRRESPAALGADEWDDVSFHGPLLPAGRVLPQGSATCYQSTSTVRLAVGGATRCPFGGRTRGAPASTARGPGWPRRRGGTRGPRPRRGGVGVAL